MLFVSSAPCLVHLKLMIARSHRQPYLFTLYIIHKFDVPFVQLGAWLTVALFLLEYLLVYSKVSAVLYSFEEADHLTRVSGFRIDLYTCSLTESWFPFNSSFLVSLLNFFFSLYLYDTIRVIQSSISFNVRWITQRDVPSRLLSHLCLFSLASCKCYRIFLSDSVLT